MSAIIWNRRQMVQGITAAMAGACVGRAQIGGEPASESVRVGESEVAVSFSGQSSLSKTELLDWVRRSATAVARYFGSFPVSRAKLGISSRPGRQGVAGG